MEERISIQRQQAYTEILEILKILGDNYTNKVPSKLIKYFEKNSLKNYKFNITFDFDFSNQIKNPITINLIGMLNYNFWCNDKEKKILLSKFIENDKRKKDNKN